MGFMNYDRTNKWTDYNYIYNVGLRDCPVSKFIYTDSDSDTL